jgi:hypothetical protein
MKQDEKIFDELTSIQGFETFNSAFREGLIEMSRIARTITANRDAAARVQAPMHVRIYIKA